MKTTIQYTDDFIVTGEGLEIQWNKAEWLLLTPIAGTLTYNTKAKILWSNNGIYFLFECEDTMISCSMTKDFDELYLEDVIEVFLWPDEKQVIYFEYEISPLGYELPLIVPNYEGIYHGWLPFKYQNDRRIISQTWIFGGEKEPGAKISGWRAKFFIPFKLLSGFGKCPPKPGTKWRANLCRLDYISTPKTQWSWSLKEMKDNFHNFHNFGTFLFIQ